MALHGPSHGPPRADPVGRRNHRAPQAVRANHAWWGLRPRRPAPHLISLFRGSSERPHGRSVCRGAAALDSASAPRSPVSRRWGNRSRATTSERRAATTGASAAFRSVCGDPGQISRDRETAAMSGTRRSLRTRRAPVSRVW